MKRLMWAVGVVLLCTSPTHAAFEALRSAASTAFDPLRPSLLYWHLAPGRLVDAAPQIHLAGAQPFGLSELSNAAVSITARPGNFGLGLSLATLGQTDYYGELLAATGVAWQPVNPLALGVILEFGRVQAGPRFDALHDWALGVGARIRVNSRFSFDGAALGIGSGQNRRGSLHRSRLSAGVTLDYSKEVSVRVGALPGQQWSLGETVKIGERVALAADLVTSPLRLSLGLLVGVGPFGFDLLYRDHPELGGDIALGVVIYT